MNDPELHQLRQDHAALRLEWERLKRAHYARKFDPNQPRVPAGSSDGGRWIGEGSPGRPTVQPAYLPSVILLAQKTIEAGLVLYTWLSIRNQLDQQAIISFTAREFRPNSLGDLDLEDVKRLDRDSVNAACPRLGEVQQRTDYAFETIKRSRGGLPPAEFGTAVHSHLKDQIVSLKDPNFLAEVSYVKNKEENYGKKDSIRIDVLERVDTTTVCVYDIKTGRAGLSVPRMTEIASNVFKAFSGTQRIIVSKIRPKP